MIKYMELTMQIEFRIWFDFILPFFTISVLIRLKFGKKSIFVAGYWFPCTIYDDTSLLLCFLFLSFLLLSPVDIFLSYSPFFSFIFRLYVRNIDEI